jgi:hypothetical protein
MKKFALAFLVFLGLAAPAAAQTINNLGAGRGSVIGADLFPSYQGANPAVRPSAAQIAAYVYSLASGDLTASGTGTHTLATVNANVGSFGSATQCTTITVNAKGLITAASQTACTPAIGSVTGLGTGVATALGVNIGSAGAPVLFNGAGGTPSSLVLTNATGLPLAQLTGAGTGVLAALAANMNSSTGPIGALTPTSGNYVRGNGTAWGSSAIQAADLPVLTVTTRTETGANPALPSSDQAKVIYLNNGSNQIPTIAQATGSFGAGWFATYCNIGAGTQTITPTTSTIGGTSTLLIPAGSAARPQCYTIISDGTNYLLSPQSGTVFSGTLSLTTTAVTSATCTAAQTVTAPGVVTTDVPLLSFNADPTASTGYVPLTSGMLTIIGYPTANTVNVKVCNNTTGSITPSAITLNVKVMR